MRVEKCVSFEKEMSLGGMVTFEFCCVKKKTVLTGLPPSLRLVPLLDDEAPLCVTIAPTRELARQIFNDFELLGAASKLVVKCFYGGAGEKTKVPEEKIQ